MNRIDYKNREGFTPPPHARDDGKSKIPFWKKNIFEFFSCSEVGGFTLIETLVSVALFATVFSVGVGAFVGALRAQRQVQALVAANSNASLAIEQMAREIRTGVGFIVSPMPGVCDDCRLEFQNAKRQRITYWRDASNNLMRLNASDLLAPGGEAVTAENVAIRYLRFEQLGNCPVGDPDATPDHAPRVTIALGVSPRSEQGVRDDLTEIQTTVSSRQGFLCFLPDL
ncbi:MAG: type II secretion system protein [Patescibacteria group bacterium]